MRASVIDRASNAATLRAASRTARQLRGNLLKVLRQLGTDYVRDTVKTDLSGRPGLDRITGFAARGVYRAVYERGGGLELVVVFVAPYLRYHNDDYVPEGGGARRHPARLRATSRWAEYTSPVGIGIAIDTVLNRGTVAPTPKAGSLSRESVRGALMRYLAQGPTR